MSFSTVRQAVEETQHKMHISTDVFSHEMYIQMHNQCEMMRYYLVRGDATAFNNYVTRKAAVEPGASDYLLTRLFQRLGIVGRPELTTLLVAQM